MTPINILSIDQQVCFAGHTDGSPYSARWSTLPVRGSVDNFMRTARVVNHNRKKIGMIWRTGDAHKKLHIGHGISWSNWEGKSPDPFTIITPDMIEDDVWIARDPARRAWFLKYARQLEKQGNKKLIIWPEHGLVGTPGQNFFPDMANAVESWEAEMQISATTIWKGIGCNAEMYSPFRAEVIDPDDPLTRFNVPLVEEIGAARGIKLLAGDAWSHCFGDGVQDIARHLPKNVLQDFYILTDCTSAIDSVPGGPDFLAIGKAIFAEAESLGMKLTTSAEFLN